MALAPERVDRGGVVVANLLLLRVVPHTHADVVVACPALARSQNGRQECMGGWCSPPDVEWELEAHNENTLVYLARPVSECVLAWVGVQASGSSGKAAVRTSVSIEATVFVWVIVRWVVFVES